MRSASLRYLPDQRTNGHRVTLRDLIILTLSILVLCIMFVETIYPLRPDVHQLLQWFDNAVCFIFLGDFAWRLWTAPNKLHFLRWGWIDLVSSIPSFDFLRWGRIVRIVRILRILRSVRSVKAIVSVLIRAQPRAGIGLVGIFAVLLVMFSAIAILNVEPPVEANIRSAGDAVWWAIATITTVGYGDKYPVTTEGRVIATVLMFCGISLFGVFTAFLASLLMRSQSSSSSDVSALIEEVRLLRAEVARLRPMDQMPYSTDPNLVDNPSANPTSTYGEHPRQS